MFVPLVFGGPGPVRPRADRPRHRPSRFSLCLPLAPLWQDAPVAVSALATLAAVHAYPVGFVLVAVTAFDGRTLAAAAPEKVTRA